MIVQRKASSCSNSGALTSYPSTASGAGRSNTQSLIDATTSGPATIFFTVNLELRMAQTLRFLATIHTMKNSFNAATPVKENDIIANLEAAIKCHDDAVSLLVV